jgi:N-acyl-D-amino-acid deacylase
MRAELREALDHGALGLSSGLQYASAFGAHRRVMSLAEPRQCRWVVRDAHAHRVRRHPRRDGQAFRIRRHARVPVPCHTSSAHARELGRASKFSTRSVRRAHASGATAIRTPPAPPRST